MLLAVASVTVAFRGDVPCDAWNYQPACYVTLEPGPTEDALRLVSIDSERTYASTGELLLTTVGVDTSVNLLEWVRGAVSGQVQQVPRESIFGPDETSEDVRRRNVAQMEASQVEAASAALRHLGYDVASEGGGARILEVLEDTPAEGHLEVGDVIVAVSGEPVTSAEEAVDAVRAHQVGDRIAVTVRRGGERVDVPIELAAGQDDPSTPQVGVLLRTDIELPVDIAIDAGSIGGPSAGLMFALAIIDLLGPDDLTGGAVVAGTGVIASDGAVGAVGGIQQKILGALRRGGDNRPASVFLVPHRESSSNFDEARSTPVRDDILLIPVGTLDDAVAALLALREGHQPEGAYALSPAS